MKKFISIQWVYPKYVQNLKERNNYVLHPFVVAHELGYACEMLLIDPPDEVSVPEYIRVFRYRDVFSYVAYLWRNRREIVYVNSLVWQSLIAGIFLYDATFMPHGYAYPNSLAKRAIVSTFYRFFRSIWVTNSNEGAKLRRLLISKRKEWICPLVVDDFGIVFRERNFSREREQPLRLLMASAIKEAKDPKTVIRAMKVLEERGVNFQLTVAGEDRIGLGNFVSGDPALAERVSFLGKYTQEDLPGLFDAADIFIQSSVGEGQCLGVHEAALAGLPLCLSSIPSFTDVFERSALFHSVGDAGKLASNILQYANAQVDANTMTRRNRDYVRSHCSYTQVSNDLRRHFFPKRESL